MVDHRIFFLLSLFVAVAFSDSIVEEEDGSDEAMENHDLFEGDILGFDPNDDRNAVIRKKKLWPQGRVPYFIDEKLAPKRSKILRTMRHYANKTCIRFEPKRPEEKQYLRIFPGKGCYSYVGRMQKYQALSLGIGCYNFGTIVHELGHAIGFFHEHSRSDRDDYINVHYENIQEGRESQFRKHRPTQNLLLTPFDFNSIMLYGETAFSKNRRAGLKTITAKDGTKIKSTFHKTGLSDNDVEKIRKLYKCGENGD